VLQNKLIKLRILGVGLLLGIGYNETIVTASSDRDALQLEAKQIINAFGVLNSRSSSERQKREAKEFFHSKGIIPEACYKQEDIDRAWNGELASFAQNVVCVGQNVHNKDSGQFQSYVGTGTLINVDKPGLEGRVLLTCAHAILPNFRFFYDKNNNIEELFSPENGGDQVISIHSQKLRHFKRVDSRCFFRERWFALGKNDVTFSIEVERRRGGWDNIPITDIYILTDNEEGTNCYDVAVCILRKPVKLEGKIVPGIGLNELNTIQEVEIMDENHSFHIRLEGSSAEALPVDKRPVVIGYGITGLKPLISKDLFLCFSEMQKRSLFGFGIKKVITLNGLDLNGQGVFQNMKGCNCAEYSRSSTEFLLSSIERWGKLEDLLIQFYEVCMRMATDCLQKMDAALREGNRMLAGAYRDLAKQWLKTAKEKKDELKLKTTEKINEGSRHLEQFRATKSLYAAPLAGCGFSGSLVVRKSDDGRYDAIGIYSGPLFTNEIKDFIKNAAQHYCENYFCRSDEQGIWKRLRQWIRLFF
jgi:hypothetical protein